MKRRHEGAEMTTTDEPRTRNYDSDKRNVKSTATIRQRQSDSDLQRILAEEIAFYNKVKLSMSIDSGFLLYIAMSCNFKVLYCKYVFRFPFLFSYFFFSLGLIAYFC